MAVQSNSESPVHLGNWRRAPYNKWGFRNVDTLIKTQTIKKAATPSGFKESPQSLDTIQFHHAGETVDWQTYLSSTDTDGVVVLSKGSVVYERYFNDNEASSKHILMSMTKSITGLVFGILQSQGKINAEDPVTKYVPEVEEVASYAKCRLRHLLDMRSGNLASDQSNEYRAAGGWSYPQGDGPHPNLYEFIVGLKDAERKDPGGPFEYQSINTDLLGWCLERATGKKQAELISELLWQPMGAEYDANMTLDRDGNARAAGGMSAALRDVARVGHLIASNGGGVVPRSWVQDMLSNGATDAYAEGIWAKALGAERSQGMAYRSCWVCNGDAQFVMALGIHGQALLVDVENDIVMAKTSSQANAVDFKPIVLGMDAFQAAKKFLLT